MGCLMLRALLCLRALAGTNRDYLWQESGCRVSEAGRHLRFSSSQTALPHLGVGDSIVHTAWDVTLMLNTGKKQERVRAGAGCLWQFVSLGLCTDTFCLIAP